MEFSGDLVDLTNTEVKTIVKSPLQDSSSHNIKLDNTLVKSKFSKQNLPGK